MQVAAPFTPLPPLECQEVAARDVVVATLRGGYDGMAEVCGAIGAHIISPLQLHILHQLTDL